MVPFLRGTKEPIADAQILRLLENKGMDAIRSDAVAPGRGATDGCMPLGVGFQNLVLFMETNMPYIIRVLLMVCRSGRSLADESEP